MPRLRNRPGNGASLGRYKVAEKGAQRFEIARYRTEIGACGGFIRLTEAPSPSSWSRSASTVRSRPSELSLFQFGDLQPLKSHKTAKSFFGNVWRKQAEIWKSLPRSEEHT